MYLKDEALENGESCSCKSVKSEDDIVELNWKHSTWMSVKVLILGGREGGRVWECDR